MGVEGNPAALLAVEPLGAVLRDGDGREPEERQAALQALAAIGGDKAEQLMVQVLLQPKQPLELRRLAAEALGTVTAPRESEQERWRLLEKLLEGEEVLPLRQGASRAIQVLVAARRLPILGQEEGRIVPMLTLTTAMGLVSTAVQKVRVWQLPLPGGLPLEVVAVPAGTYTIGAAEDEFPYPREIQATLWQAMYARSPGCKDREHLVEVRLQVHLQACALARYPITQAQWRSLASLEAINRDLNPDPHAERKGDDLPVVNVSWQDAREWCDRLNRHLLGRIGLMAPAVGLPSEAQWEVACRAGSGKPFHFGDTIDAAWANYDGRSAFPPGGEGERVGTVTAVGAYGVVNRWGLADMHGNVWEWCQDRWHHHGAEGPDDRTAQEQPAPGLNEMERQFRLLRGGSWINDPQIRTAPADHDPVPASWLLAPATWFPGRASQRWSFFSGRGCRESGLLPRRSPGPARAGSAHHG
ncbi:MAG: formylglycine-generating enzyme family protein [Cyanobium sp. CZS 48M]|nr:formylglycine-generating enzyme family protein [Cyanobium sp. CZS48M]